MSKHRMKVAFHVQREEFTQAEGVASASSSGTAEWVAHAASDASFAFLDQFTPDSREFHAIVFFWEVEEVDVSPLGSPEKLVTVSGSNTHEQQAEATGSAEFVANIVSGAASMYEVLHAPEGPEPDGIDRPDGYADAMEGD